MALRLVQQVLHMPHIGLAAFGRGCMQIIKHAKVAESNVNALFGAILAEECRDCWGLIICAS